jgi:fumarate hydratase class II
MTPRVITLRAGIEPKSSASSPGKILLLAHREDLSLKDAALKLGYLTAEQFDKGCGPEDMTHSLTK